MDWEKIKSNKSAPMYRVMLFKAIGQYPEGILYTSNGFFSADKDLVFSVTYGGSWQAIDEDIAYSDFDWASPEELRLLSSILLCEKREGAKVNFYPVIHYHSYIIDVKHLDLSSCDTVSSVKELLLKTSCNPRAQPGENILLECIAGDYQLVPPKEYNLDRLPLFYDKISVKNYVLMRGIASLIKATMLTYHREFFEEATIVSFVALEASFCLVCRELSSGGNKKPTRKDAALWVYNHFDKALGFQEPTNEKYFGEIYDERVKAVHPVNRFNIETPFSTIEPDDFYLIRESVREIFAYLIVGEHGSDYHKEVKSRKKGRFV